MFLLYGLHVKECAPYTETTATELCGGRFKMTLPTVYGHPHELLDLYDLSVATN